MIKILLTVLLLFPSALIFGVQEDTPPRPDDGQRFILIEELSTSELEYFSSYIRPQESVLTAFRATLPVSQDYMPFIRIDYLIFEFLPEFGFEYPAAESVPYRSTQRTDELYVLIMSDANPEDPYSRMMVYYDGTVSAIYYPMPPDVLGVWNSYTLNTPVYIVPGQFVSLFGLYEQESTHPDPGNLSGFFGNYLHLGRRNGQFFFDVAISHSASLE